MKNDSIIVVAVVGVIAFLLYSETKANAATATQSTNPNGTGDQATNNSLASALSGITKALQNMGKGSSGGGSGGGAGSGSGASGSAAQGATEYDGNLDQAEGAAADASENDSGEGGISTVSASGEETGGDAGGTGGVGLSGDTSLLGEETAPDYDFSGSSTGGFSSSDVTASDDGDFDDYDGGDDDEDDDDYDDYEDDDDEDDDD